MVDGAYVVFVASRQAAAAQFHFQFDPSISVAKIARTVRPFPGATQTARLVTGAGVVSGFDSPFTFRAARELLCVGAKA
jgi:hypothetical protein